MLTYESNRATRIPHSVSHPDPKSRLDNFMSLRVSDCAQKSYPGRRTLGVKLDRPIMTQMVVVILIGIVVVQVVVAVVDSHEVSRA